MTADKIVYRDAPGHRVLDLRPDGVDCIPSLRLSDFRAVQPSVDFHCHPGCMEFCYCLRGNLVFDTPEREYRFLPDHVFVSAPDQPHHLRNNPSGLRTYSILFRIPSGPARRRVLGLDARGSEWLVRSLTHLPKRIFAATGAVRESFERLFAVYDGTRRASPARRVKMRAAALDLLVALIEDARRLPGRAPDAIEAIAERIRADPAGEHPVAEMARESGRSVSNFTAAFRRAKGLPPHAYVLACRIDRAKRMLSSTPRTVDSIANELRFSSAQHFARIFRRIVGTSPSAYRG